MRGDAARKNLENVRKKGIVRKGAGVGGMGSPIKKGGVRVDKNKNKKTSKNQKIKTKKTSTWSKQVQKKYKQKG